jgi:hypothetical protein
MTVLLPRRSHLSFIDHSCLRCIVCIALSEVWGSIFLIVFLNWSRISPPQNVIWIFLPQFWKLFRTLVNEETLITYFIHMITSCKWNYFLIRMWVLCPHFTSRTQHSLLSVILSQVTLVCHSYLEVRM